MMRTFVLALCIFLTCQSCAQAPSKDLKIPEPGSTRPGKYESVATFAQGCFWHTEIVFQSLKGVRDAVSGYAGGKTKDPSYEQVSTGQTGHAESVQVYYDSTIISFETLVKVYFASMDPTTLNRQGNDVGTEYRSIAFYRNQREKNIIEEAIRNLNNSKKYRNPVVTEVKAFTQFYPAETYHQEYIYHHPQNPYVKNVSLPEYLEFRKHVSASLFKNQ